MDENCYFLVIGIALSAIALIIIMVWALMKCSKKCCNRNKKDLDYDNNLSTQQLIPPIFYTEIKDPLLQDDLMEKLPRDR